MNARPLLLACVLGCSPLRPPEASTDPTPPNEKDACARFCDRLEQCEVAPSGCAPQCARDQTKMREGIFPALAACTDRELGSCRLLTAPERRSRLSLCWSATIEAYAARFGTDAIARVVAAVCTRESRCSSEVDRVTCEKELSERLTTSAQAKTLAVARAELLESITKCVATKECEVADPVTACDVGD
jgi:hypothetical protein